MWEKFDRLWSQYHNTFGDYFPTMCFQADGVTEQIERMEACLRSGKRAEEVYQLNYSGDVLY